MGYLPPAAVFNQIPSVSAAIKFFHTNRLGDLVVFNEGECLNQLVNAVESKKRTQWKPDPGNLVYIEPMGSYSAGQRKRLGLGRNGAALYNAGGLFLLRASGDIVFEALQRMRYLEKGGQADYQAALELFVKLNENALGKYGVVAVDAEAREKRLREVSIAQDSRQLWRIPPSDTQPRADLLAKGCLKFSIHHKTKYW